MKKSSKAIIELKEEDVCADKIKIDTDKDLCDVTGSAVILSVQAQDREIRVHLTDVELIKLQTNLSLLKLNRGEQVAHE